MIGDSKAHRDIGGGGDMVRFDSLIWNERFYTNSQRYDYILHSSASAQ